MTTNNANYSEKEIDIKKTKDQPQSKFPKVRL